MKLNDIKEALKSDTLTIQERKTLLESLLEQSIASGDLQEQKEALNQLKLLVDYEMESYFSDRGNYPELLKLREIQAKTYYDEKLLEIQQKVDSLKREVLK